MAQERWPDVVRHYADRIQQQREQIKVLEAKVEELNDRCAEYATALVVAETALGECMGFRPTPGVKCWEPR
jgi:hypothetical protein